MNQKVQPRFIDGAKYIHLSDLPETQVSMFRGWYTLPANIANEIKSESQDFIEYEEYDYWFDYHYLTIQNLDELI